MENYPRVKVSPFVLVWSIAAGVVFTPAGAMTCVALGALGYILFGSGDTIMAWMLSSFAVVWLCLGLLFTIITWKYGIGRVPRRKYSR